MSEKDDKKQRLIEERGMFCGICRKPLTLVEIFSHRVNLDHIVSRYEGGGNDLSNLQLAHKSCNTQKGY